MSTSEELIFQQALEIQNGEERDAYPETACAGNPEVLKGVRSLLNAWRHGEFLESTLPEVAVVRTFGNDQNTHQLGPYRIIESLGRGGMGAVFLAEQTEPVRRRVAIKIVRPELDSPNVVKRFLPEQRTLAKMDHPKIAKVLDASISEQGISYFVMELVNGVPILEFCQTQDLSIRDRLDLFRECCAAILHAHQNSVIHRDIKPSNTLVTTQHGKPLIKIIDFGIAKALDPKESAEPNAGDTVETFQEYKSGELDASLAELPPRVIRIEPPLQDGMLPLNNPERQSTSEEFCGSRLVNAPSKNQKRKHSCSSFPFHLTRQQSFVG
jgi:serine/threonine protein kinase